MLFGAEDGGGGGHELGRLGIAGVHRRYRQPPEEVGRVGAEDVLVDVGLVDDDVPEPGQEFPHRRAVGPAGHPGVAHVGGHDHHPGPADDGIPLINSHIAVDLPDGLPRQPDQLAGLQPASFLVVGQRLGGIENQGGGFRSGFRAGRDSVKGPCLEHHRFARGGGGGHHDILTPVQSTQGLGLVQP